VRLIARGGSGAPASEGRAQGQGGAGALVTFRALAPTGIQAPPELCGKGGSGEPSGASVTASLSWYCGSAQWRSDVAAVLGTRIVARAA